MPTETKETRQVGDAPETARARSASGRTVVTATVHPKGQVQVVVSRYGRVLERIDLGYEENLGPHSNLRTDGKKLYVTQSGQHPATPPDVIEIV